MPPTGFEPTIPASECPQTHVSDRAATRNDIQIYRIPQLLGTAVLPTSPWYQVQIVRDMVASSNDKNRKHYKGRLPVCTIQYLLWEVPGYPVEVFPALRRPEGSLQRLNGRLLDHLLRQFSPDHVLTRCHRLPF